MNTNNTTNTRHTITLDTIIACRNALAAMLLAALVALGVVAYATSSWGSYGEAYAAGSDEGYAEGYTDAEVACESAI